MPCHCLLKYYDVWDTFAPVRIFHTDKNKENLSREVLQVQKAMNWPGLIREVKEICKTVGLGDVNRKYLYRKEVLEYMQYYDIKCAKEKIKPLEKCRIVRNRNCRHV